VRIGHRVPPTAFKNANSFLDALPTFSPSSSSELDTLLTRFREQLFIPASLGPRHRQLVYKKKYVDQLTNQRVMVNIKGTDDQVRLQPMRIEDRPTTEDFKTAVTLMKTRADWDNLLPLLSGMKASNRRIPWQRWDWLVRKTCEAGMPNVVLRCARQSARTGLKLQQLELVKNLYLGFHAVAQSADFKGEAVENTLKQAKQAAFLVTLPKKKAVSAERDPARQPSIIGVLLELSAARSLDAFGGKDESGEVATYSKRVLDTWVLGDFNFETEKWTTANNKLQEMIPLWHGMKLALRVNEISADEYLRTNLTNRIKELGSKIEAATKRVSESGSSGLPKGLKMSQEMYVK
jgi:hypothetical protein